MKTRLKNRILFFDGESAWEEQNLIEQIFSINPDEVFSIDPLPGIDQKMDSNPLPEIKWNIPSEYLERDIGKELIQEATQISPEAVERVKKELLLYQERDMIPLLQTLLYVRDKMMEKKVVWGVGRGSSVASYVLYLMRIHLVDSLKYGLSIKEFLR